MSVRPIIFSATMIRALLDGRKTQTRRVLRDQATWDRVEAIVRRFPRQKSGVPYAPGDRLWVRETFSPSAPKPAYRADHGPEADGWGWTPSIHMPRWASRLTLIVTDVRVQRVQEISEEDAEAEGVRGNAGGAWGREGLIEDFADLWDSLNAKRGFGWEANSFVVALTFTVHRQNIDQLQRVAAE